MIRLTTTLWLVLIAVAGGALFHVSYQVGQLESQRRGLDQAIAKEEQAIRVLRAEWAYLTQPGRLEDLAHQFTDLAPLHGLQLTAGAGEIPMPLPAGPLPVGTPETRIVPLQGVPGLHQVPLPILHPQHHDRYYADRQPGPPPAPAGVAASSPAPTAPPTAPDGDAATQSAPDFGLIRAAFVFRSATGTAPGEGR